jgi:hypothetical protein
MVRRKLTNGIYEAEFFLDSTTTNVHWVVCLVHSVDIVMWGVAPSMELAEDEAVAEMKALNKQVAAKA